MKYKHRLLTLGLVTGALASCGNEAPTRFITGTLDTPDVSNTASEIVATNGFGEDSVASVGDDGFFELALREDDVVSIAFRRADDQRTIGQLSFQDRRRTFRATRGEDIDIGRVVRSDMSTGSDEDTCWGRGEPGSSVEQRSSFLLVADRDLVQLNEPVDESNLSGALGDDDSDGRCNHHDLDDDDDGICDDDDDGRAADDCDSSDDDAGTCDDSCDDNDEDAGVCDQSCSDGDQDASACEDRKARADIPYAVRPALGESFRLMDAFIEEGIEPLEIVSVEMEDPWRLTELRTGTAFEVTQADCDHEGGRGTGRDRAIIAWRNPDSSMDIDHLDIRYCDD